MGHDGEFAGTRRLAFLVFDSHEDIALVGSRSAALRPRRMLFQSGPAALDLELRTDRRGAPVTLLGHIRGEGVEAGASIRFNSEHGFVDAPIDEQGWFEIESVRAGDYSITITLGAMALEVPSLVV